MFLKRLKLLDDKKPFGFFVMIAFNVELNTDFDAFVEFIEHRILELYPFLISFSIVLVIVDMLLDHPEINLNGDCGVASASALD